MKQKKILVFSSVHPWNDGRIFFREIESLSKYFVIELHAVADFSFRSLNDIKVFGLPKWSSIFDRIKTLFILSGRIFKSDANYFHFHDPELLLLVPFIKIFKKGVIIFDVHENYPLIIMEKEYIPQFLRKSISCGYMFFEYLLLFFVDKVIYTTKKVGERYVRVKGDSAIRVGNFPSKQLFPIDPPSIGSRKERAIFIGNMTPIRGIREIISAFKIVHQYYPNYELILMGRFYSEDFKAEINELIQSLHLVDTVKIEGEIPYGQLNEVLYDCRIGYVTFLSYPNNIACLPNKLIEYMAAGMAIVASNFENYEEILLPNNCGTVVIPEDPQAIASATLTYIEDKNLLQEHSKNARQTFLEIYNWEREMGNLLKIYNLT